MLSLQPKGGEGEERMAIWLLLVSRACSREQSMFDPVSRQKAETDNMR